MFATQSSARISRTLARISYLATLFILFVTTVSLSSRYPWLISVVTLGGLAFGPVLAQRAWHDTHGTALRPTVVWFACAWGFAVLSQVQALREPIASGRPWSGHSVYLCALASTAGLLSVLNARRPGAGAWAWLMGVLMLVFAIPWMESQGAVAHSHLNSRLHLEPPWNVFFGLLAGVGVANFLPTRFWPAALGLGASLGIVLVRLSATHLSLTTQALLWLPLPVTYSLVCMYALIPAVRDPSTHAESRADRAWLWFRDRWGAAWGLRVQERFNREAHVANAKIQLSWEGTLERAQDDTGPTQPVHPNPARFEAYESLRSILKRFVDPSRLDAISGLEVANRESPLVDAAASSPKNVSTRE